MKVVTFGELMIRLQPYNYERFVQADHLEFTFGGGEANVDRPGRRPCGHLLQREGRLPAGQRVHL